MKPKFEKATKIYFALSALCLILWRVCVSLRATAFGARLVISQMLDVAPNFFTCVALPFLILAVVKVFFTPKRETRLFYYIIFGTLVLAILTEYYLYAAGVSSFDIFDIIASCIAAFVNMVIHDKVYFKKPALQEDEEQQYV